MAGNKRSKKTQTIEPPPFDVFFSSFAGEKVDLQLNILYSEQHQSEDALETKTYSMSSTGYLLDVDDNYYYLGDTPNSVTQAVRKNFVIQIRLTIDDNDGYVSILDKMPVPENNEEIN